jgi:hypothetical protein
VLAPGGRLALTASRRIRPASDELVADYAAADGLALPVSVTLAVARKPPG